jgi:hypothetical protein
LPTGVTLMGPWGSDARLAGLGTRLHRASSSRAGATPFSLAPALAPSPLMDDAILVAVAGAHLSGEPLNHQLTARGGTLARACKTAPRYRLFALPDTTPPKPGLLRVDTGAAIDVEVWRLSSPRFHRRSVSRRSNWRTASRSPDSFASLTPPSVRRTSLRSVDGARSVGHSADSQHASSVRRLAGELTY